MTYKQLLKATITLLLLACFAGASTITVQFTGISSQTANGYYVGYTEATVAGMPFSDILCDDFIHVTYVPSGPFVYSDTTLADLSTVRFDSNNLTKRLIDYEVAAILLYEYDALGSAKNALAGDYNFALWKLFTPTAGNYGTSSTLLNDAVYQQLHGSAITIEAYNELHILTPFGNATNNQEFLKLGTGDFGNRQAPEVGTVFLLGIGLVGLALYSRRFIKL